MGLGSCEMRGGRRPYSLRLDALFRLCSVDAIPDVCSGLAGVVGLGNAAGGGDENPESVSAQTGGQRRFQVAPLGADAGSK